MIRVTKYTPPHAIEAAARVETYIRSTFQPSLRVVRGDEELDIPTTVVPWTHTGRNAPKRITSSQRRAMKRTEVKS